MLCKNCGRELSDNALFCKYCGKKVNEEIKIKAYENSEEFNFDDRFIKYNDTNSYCVRSISNILNMPINESNFLVNLFLIQLHKEWIDEYQNKTSYKKAREYIIDMEKLKNNNIPIYINLNKYQELLEELENKIENNYDNKIENAKSRDEEIQLEEEKNNKLITESKSIDDKMINELISRYSEFNDYLENYKSSIKAERNKNICTTIFISLYYIYVSFLLFYLIFIWLGIKIEDNYILYLVLSAIDSVLCVFASKSIKNTTIKLIAPIIIPILLLSAMSDVSRESTQSRNEYNAPYTEAKRQALVNDFYNKKFK